MRSKTISAGGGEVKHKGWTTQSILELITCNLAVRLMFGGQQRGRESVEPTEPSISFTVCQSNKM